MRKIILVLICSILIPLSSYSQCTQHSDIGGLRFHDNNDLIEKRTSFKMFDTPQDFSKEVFRLSFEIAIAPDYPLGHLITCKNENEEIFNLICRQGTGKNKHRIFFNLNLTFAGEKIVLSFPDSLFGKTIWQKCSIGIYPKTRRVELGIADQSSSFTIEEEDIKKLDTKVNFIFGKCDHYLDVLPFAIRGLEYTNDREKIFYPLTETQGSDVHSSTGKVMGYVDNPEWLYRNHFQWKKLEEIAEKEITSVFHDPEESKLYIYSSTAFYTYDLKKEQLRKEDHTCPDRFRIQYGGGFNYWYDRSTKELIMFNNGPVNTEQEKRTAVFNKRDKTLEYKGDLAMPTKYHHNSVFSSRKGPYLYQFGGYGDFMYHNVFYQIDRNTFTCDTVYFHGDQIKPRFYTSIGADPKDEDGAVYLFGGYGNTLGDQYSGGQFFYDLFHLDIKKKEVQKVFDFKADNIKKVPCRDLVIGEDGHSFYTLCYSHYEPDSNVQLYRFDWEDGTCSVVSDSIPFISIAISTQIHLFEDKETNSMISVIQEFGQNSRKNSIITISKLSTPILPIEEYASITQIVQQKHRTVLKITFYALLILLVLIGIGTVSLVLLKRRKKKEEIEAKLVKIEEETNGKENLSQKNAIYLLGDFTVFDRNGTDITYLFSSKIRQLFLLILMSSIRKSSSGLSSNEISAVLWPEKELSKSKNIRAVTMKNLRDAISGVDGIQIVYNGGKWTVETNQEICTCDFLQVLHPSIELTSVTSYEQIQHYIHLLRRGQLLKSEEFDWLDSFKSEFEERVLTMYAKAMTKSYEQGEYLISYKISQVLLKSDPLNEGLMKIEINSLVRLGDSVKAMVKFRQFSIGYYEAYQKNLLFEDYIDK